MIRFAFTNFRAIRARLYLYEDMRRDDPAALERMLACMRARQ